MSSGLAAFTTLLLAATPVSAAQAGYSKTYDTCMAKAQSTLDMDDCDKGEIGRRTTLLNKAYQDAMDRLGDRLHPQFKAAEKAWIASRDADCSLYEDREEFGSSGVVSAGQCMIERTISRTKDLQRMFPDMTGQGR